MLNINLKLNMKLYEKTKKVDIEKLVTRKEMS